MAGGRRDLHLPSAIIAHSIGVTGNATARAKPAFARLRSSERSRKARSKAPVPTRTCAPRITQSSADSGGRTRRISARPAIRSFMRAGMRWKLDLITPWVKRVGLV